MSYVSVRKSRKCEENVTSKRCGLATFTECVPLPPEARGLNASTAGSHQTYNSWRARSCFEHTKQAKVGGQSAGPKACLALLAERKQQWMLSRRRERLPFPLSRSPVRTFRVLLGRFMQAKTTCLARSSGIAAKKCRLARLPARKSVHSTAHLFLTCVISRPSSCKACCRVKKTSP